MRGIRIRAYAKINPLLAVGETMGDGYHEIRTVYQLVNLSDLVEITPSDEMTVECTVQSLCGEANLSAKAIRFLKEWIDVPPLKVRIEKHIPTEAGLGGGSSDAACTILGINRILGNPLSQSDLLTLARACGADVPFFVLRTPRAFGRGDGSILTSLSTEPSQVVLLAKPPVGMRTELAYKLLDAKPRRTKLEEVSCDEYGNDFDIVAPPESRQLVQHCLDCGASHAHLCGSGSAVYATFQSEADAYRCASAMAQLAEWMCVTHTLQHIPEPEWI